MEGGMTNIPIVNLDWLIESAKERYMREAIYYWNLSLDKKFNKTSRNNCIVFSWCKLFIRAAYRD